MIDEEIEAAIRDRMNWVSLGWNREINEKVIDLAREALRARKRVRELEGALQPIRVSYCYDHCKVSKGGVKKHSPRCLNAIQALDGGKGKP